MNAGHVTPRLRHRRSRQQGVSLVEVLVSVLVVSIGMLGAAALSAAAMRNNQGSYERTQTAILTQGIFDAMRANLGAVGAGGYDTGGYVCSVAGATASLAASDIARWVATVKSQINADACGQIACVAGVCTVSVRWDDSRSSGGSSSHTVVVKAQL